MFLLLILAACSRQQAELTRGNPISGGIRAGESISFQVRVPPGHLARITLEQHEIDLAVETGGLRIDNGEWGREVAYLAGTGFVDVRVVAGTGNSSQGRFVLTLDFLRRIAPNDGLVLEAQPLEAQGHILFDKRSAKTQAEAREKFRVAADLWAQFGDPQKEAQVLLLLGRASEREGKYAIADRHYERAHSLLEHVGDVAGQMDTRKIWCNLGGYLGQERGTLAELQTQLEGWIKLGERRGITRLALSLARVFWDLGNRAKALELAQLSRDLRSELGDKAGQAETLVRLSGFETEAGRLEVALTYATEAQTIYRNLNDVSGELSSLSLLSDIYALLGRTGEARSMYLRARTLHSDRGDWASWMAATTNLANAETRLGRVEQAWRHLSEVTSRSELDLAGDPGRHPSSFFGGPPQSVIPAAGILSRGDTHHEFDGRTFMLVDFWRGRFLAGRRSVGLETLQNALGPEDVALEYVTDPGDAAVVWAVTYKGVVSHRLPPGNLPVLATDVAASFAERGSIPDTEKRSRLAALLLKPLAGQLQNKRLLIVPDRFLARLPFAALPDPERSDGSLLGDHHEIVYLPSVQGIVVIRERSRPVSDGGFAIIADPVMNRHDIRLMSRAEPMPSGQEWLATARSAGLLKDGAGLPRLANAAAEVRTFSDMLGGRLNRLTGFDATREAVSAAASRARFVHFVTHGLVDWNRPDLSGLALTLWGRGGEAQDGYWRFDEIASGNMTADLITLGACETGVGRQVNQQGIPSLSNAFLRAGARRVVSSLWKVDDAATSALMIEFYRNLLGPVKMSPANALQNAQRRVASEIRWRHPYYWAGFVLSGDWRPL